MFKMYFVAIGVVWFCCSLRLRVRAIRRSACVALNCRAWGGVVGVVWGVAMGLFVDSQPFKSDG